MANPIVQFVDAPSTTATLRYDCSLKTPSFQAFPLTAEGIDFGAPPFTGDPGGVGAIYGYRSIRFTQRIIGTKSVALARMSLLAKEMLRPTNWLRFQWDASTSPVWFKTYATEPGGMTLENAEASGAWDISVPLTADPFAYGVRQTHSTVQVIQSPADLTGPTRLALRYVLPTIKGDAPTMLRVQVTPAGTSNAASGSSWLIGCTSGSSALTDSVIDIGTGDGFTAGTGTAAPTADANYFSGSYRAVTISAGANLIERLTGNLPAVPPGRYKILLRCEADGPASTAKRFVFQMGLNNVLSYTYLPSVSVTANPTALVGGLTRKGWVDLGDFNLPFGVDDRTVISATSFTTAFSLKIGTADSTSGAVRIDAFKLIPVSGPTVDRSTLMVATFPNGFLTGNVIGTFDGDAEMYQGVGSGTGFYTSAQPQIAGWFPQADPASTQNILTIMALDQGVVSGTVITTKDTQAAVDVSYYPRYLHIGDGT